MVTAQEIERILPESKNIQAVVVFRLCEEAPFVCVAAFLAAGDAQIFAAHVHPGLGIGQYKVITVDDGRDVPKKLG
jgi:hypothetical protein